MGQRAGRFLLTASERGHHRAGSDKATIPIPGLFRYPRLPADSGQGCRSASLPKQTHLFRQLFPAMEQTFLWDSTRAPASALPAPFVCGPLTFSGTSQPCCPAGPRAACSRRPSRLPLADRESPAAGHRLGSSRAATEVRDRGGPGRPERDSSVRIGSAGWS